MNEPIKFGDNDFSQTLRYCWYCWRPFVLRYSSLSYGLGKPDTYGIGWRRWVLYLYLKGAYGRTKAGFSWCNYFGENDGG